MLFFHPAIFSHLADFVKRFAYLVYGVLVILYKSGIIYYYWGTAEFKQEEIEICIEAARPKMVFFEKDTYGIEQMKRLVDADYVRSIRTIPDLDEKIFFEQISQPGFCFLSNRDYWEKP